MQALNRNDLFMAVVTIGQSTTLQRTLSHIVHVLCLGFLTELAWVVLLWLVHRFILKVRCAQPLQDSSTNRNSEYACLDCIILMYQFPESQLLL